MENKNPFRWLTVRFLTGKPWLKTANRTPCDLCRHLDLNKSTVHRCQLPDLHGICEAGFGNRNDALSFKLLTLSNKAMSHMDILETVRPFLKKLSQETGKRYTL